LSISAYSNQFVLKGALMFGVWQGPFSRPTRDVDLLGHVEHTVERVTAAMRAICQQSVPEDDGMRFDADSVAGEHIVEAASYEGVRVKLVAYLEAARVTLQVDIGFGDPLVPGPNPIRLPTLLEFPPPELQGYSRESAIAEKLQAMVYLGVINSRMKDFYDIWSLASRFEFDGAILAQAVRETFRARRTTLSQTPAAFSDVFANDREKQVQWAAFVRRIQVENAPASLSDVVQYIKAFLQPVIQALIKERPFVQRWLPGGPWG
jgi:hypothetical protein